MKWHTPAGAVVLPIEGDLPSLGGAIEWINSAPLTAAGLRGKVVLVEFWTYTCINWLRTLPYVRAWAAKYKDQGLVVIGVHSPEFEFEKSIANVRRAVRDRGSTIPSRSIASMRCGAHSGTNTGQLCISSTPRDAFDIISSAKASTIGRKWLFNSCSPKPGLAESGAIS
jgi:thiol-disulfide isomerase/thioredoxin